MTTLAWATVVALVSTSTGSDPSLARIGTSTHAAPPHSAAFAGLDRAGTPPGPAWGGAPLPPPLELGEGERASPNYRGRAARDTDAADVMLWVPRIALSPLWLTTEYVLRKPMVWLITRTEESKLFDRLREALTFLDGDLTFFPRVLLDFGLRPAVGLSMRWNNFIVKDNRLNVSASFWGDQFVLQSTEITARVLGDRSLALTLLQNFVWRPDSAFYGYGPNTSMANEVRFRTRDFELFGGLRAFLPGLSRVLFAVGFTSADFSEQADSPPIDFDKVEALRPLVNFDAYDFVEVVLEAELDSRSPNVDFDTASGVRFEPSLRFGVDPGPANKANFRYGGEVAGFWDVSDYHHTLAVEFYAEAMERLGSESLPVTELPTLGGTEHMRAFLPGRFVGESVMQAAVAYRWPIWFLMDAELFAEVGNAYGQHFEGFAWKRLFASFGGMLRSSWSREVNVDVLFGFGTNRFDDPRFGVESFRFTLNFTRGF